eukprot:TRINITY_DN10577_c0_g3_i1.p1 TRINITY_DN10577_c0_g3~~TRINITY_DN10577_c0_g3_i1.p1  ORF type:complete len:265 (-),score=62.67 TRINITY_DN10577_c0_g3_i1:123-845(-)
MSLPEIRAFFDKEIDKYMVVCKKDAGGNELPYLGDLQRLANTMRNNVLQRFVNFASTLKLNDDVLHGRSLRPEALRTDNPGLESKVAQLRAREKELEAMVNEKRQEQQRRRERMQARFQSQFEDSLHNLEQQLVDIRRAVTFDHQDSISSDEATRLHQDLAEQERRILEVANETRETVRAMQLKKQQIETVEEQQSRATPAIESLLANVREDWDEPEDQALEESIRKGEQVSKRLRRLLV